MKPVIIKIMREIVLFFGILVLIWGVAQYEHAIVQHGVGTQSAPIETQMASPGSMIWVKTTSSNITETRVIKLEERDAFFQNGTLVDKHLAAGGVSGGGRGTSVELSSSAPARTASAYVIVVLDGDGTTDNIESIDYKVEYTLWSPNYLFMLFGFMLIFFSLVFRSMAKLQTREVPVDVREPVRAPSARERAPAKAPMPRRPPPRRPEPEPYPEEEEEEEYYPPSEREAEPEIVREPPVEKRKPVGRIRCSACAEIIPLYSKKRPMRVICPSCGRSGTLR